MEDFISIRCRTCDGVAHPAAGCVYSSTFIVCGPCTRKVWEWIVQHTKDKGRRRGPSFYDHVNVIAQPMEVPAV